MRRLISFCILSRLWIHNFLKLRRAEGEGGNQCEFILQGWPYWFGITVLILLNKEWSIKFQVFTQVLDSKSRCPKKATRLFEAKKETDKLTSLVLPFLNCWYFNINSGILQSEIGCKLWKLWLCEVQIHKTWKPDALLLLQNNSKACDRGNRKENPAWLGPVVWHGDLWDQWISSCLLMILRLNRLFWNTKKRCLCKLLQHLVATQDKSINSLYVNVYQYLNIP